MRFRKLRIAWSVGWGLLAVLLMALWVRSYSWEDRLVWVQGSARNIFSFESRRGLIQLVFNQSGDAEEQLLSPFLSVHRPINRHLKMASFAWTADAVRVSFRFPVWLLMMLIAAIGVASWIPRSKRFSLRSLLIATTLVAVVLGAGIYAVRS